MLVDTLENLAKDLILIVQETNRRYFDIVNPFYL
jgi:hypothetical protein